MMAALTPAALARPVPLPWGGVMPLGGFLERYPVEILVHTWDLAQATGQAAVQDPPPSPPSPLSPPKIR
jgi:hypothetical protein